MKLYYSAFLILSCVSVADADYCSSSGGTWTGYVSGGCALDEVWIDSVENSWFGPTNECCAPATCGDGNIGNGVCPAVAEKYDTCCTSEGNCQMDPTYNTVPGLKQKHTHPSCQSSSADDDYCSDNGGTWTGYVSGGCASDEVCLDSVEYNPNSWNPFGPTNECCAPATCGGGNIGNGICPGGAMKTSWPTLPFTRPFYDKCCTSEGHCLAVSRSSRMLMRGFFCDSASGENDGENGFSMKTWLRNEKKAGLRKGTDHGEMVPPE
eukprot:CAMPEP_0181100414 /NCGR_PEP_ID=MMETSP1071-20121207/13181_1 /TAXON_ID=35127 /ORGANISM="Thalassiosira sp., Strain NH16" /LENGTH=264 /DNA_ID=CAMNT_0023183143 /DNA_START=96 /DNA_END=890 /DNA_ORIENTATION=-